MPTLAATVPGATSGFCRNPFSDLATSEPWRCHGSLRVRSHGVGRQFNDTATMPRTGAILDLAREATETAQQPRTAARLEFEESNQSLEAAESEPAPLDSSEAWFEAIEAFEDAVEAAEDATAAGEAANAAAAASHGAAADAKDADWARAILNAAAFDGDWEAMTADIESHLAAALAAVRAAENFEREALEAQAAAAAAAAAASAFEEGWTVISHQRFLPG